MKANTFFALMGGLAAGVVLGMLIAPESGEENRKKFRSKIEDYLDKCRAEAERMHTAAAAESAGEEEAPSNE
ncbi:MAG: YtxH domain-containing protein [Bacteroidales bacterium]|jgi:gas vesicle protein|nr:YtxH domain-containing protein [Bacteroidales bacterium]